MHILINGEERSEIAFNPFRDISESGWSLGDGVFETLLVNHNVPFALDRHLERLFTTGSELLITLPNKATLCQWIEKVISLGDYRCGRLRISQLSSGECVLTYRELIPAAESVSVITYPHVKYSQSFTAGKKTISYAENAHAIRFARLHESDDVLFVNEVGNVIESGLANLVVEISDELITPPLSDGALPGITRALVIQYFGVNERSMSMDLVRKADALYLLSSIRSVQRVGKLDHVEFAPTTKGSELRRQFSQWMSENVNP